MLQRPNANKTLMFVYLAKPFHSKKIVAQYENNVVASSLLSQKLNIVSIQVASKIHSCKICVILSIKCVTYCEICISIKGQGLNLKSVA